MYSVVTAVTDNNTPHHPAHTRFLTQKGFVRNSTLQKIKKVKSNYINCVTSYYGSPQNMQFKPYKVNIKLTIIYSERKCYYLSLYLCSICSLQGILFELDFYKISLQLWKIDFLHFLINKKNRKWSKSSVMIHSIMFFILKIRVFFSPNSSWTSMADIWSGGLEFICIFF